jgi:hypothetical protein
MKNYLPVLTATKKLQLLARVSFICQVQHLFISHHINVNLIICTEEIRNSTVCPSVSLARPVSSTQK